MKKKILLGMLLLMLFGCGGSKEAEVSIPGDLEGARELIKEYDSNLNPKIEESDKKDVISIIDGEFVCVFTIVKEGDVNDMYIRELSKTHDLDKDLVSEIRGNNQDIRYGNDLKDFWVMVKNDNVIVRIMGNYEGIDKVKGILDKLGIKN